MNGGYGTGSKKFRKELINASRGGEYGTGKQCKELSKKNLVYIIFIMCPK